MEALHSTHPGSWGMIDLSTHAWWPYMHRDILAKAAKCNPCVKIGRTSFYPLKYVKTSSLALMALGIMPLGITVVEVKCKN